jgi:hypothetical protein
MEWLLPIMIFAAIARACVSDTFKKPEEKPPEDDLGKALTKYLGTMNKELQEIKDSLKK